MNLNKGILFFIVLLLYHYNYSKAQDKCGDLAGLVDYKVAKFDNAAWERFVKRIDEKQYNSTKSFKEDSKSFGFEYDDIDFDFNEGGRVRYQGENYNSFSEFVLEESSIKEQFYQKTKEASKVAVNAWVICKKSQRFITWVTVNGPFISLHMERGKYQGDPSRLKLEEIVFPEDVLEVVTVKKKYWFGLEYDADDYRGLVIGGSPRTITFRRRDNRKEAFLNISTNHDDYSASHQIKAIIPDIIVEEEEPCAPDIVAIDAKDFNAGLSENVCNNCHRIYGEGVITDNLPTGGRKVTYDFNVPCAGNYLMEIQYASADASRTMEITIGNRTIVRACCGVSTAGWTTGSQQWKEQGNVILTAGFNRMTLSTGGNMPHLWKFKFSPR